MSTLSTIPFPVPRPGPRDAFVVSLGPCARDRVLTLEYFAPGEPIPQLLRRGEKAIRLDDGAWVLVKLRVADQAERLHRLLSRD